MSIMDLIMRVDKKLERVTDKLDAFEKKLPWVKWERNRDIGKILPFVCGDCIVPVIKISPDYGACPNCHKWFKVE